MIFLSLNILNLIIEYLSDLDDINLNIPNLIIEYFSGNEDNLNFEYS